MKTVVNINAESVQFIQGILSETRDDFRQAFIELSKEKGAKNRRRFSSLWCALAELVVPRPAAVSMADKQGKEVTL